MRGVDSVGRAFLAFCHAESGENEIVEVIFQRYGNENHNNWAVGSDTGYTRIFRRSIQEYRKDVDYARRVVVGEPAGRRDIFDVEHERTDDEGKSVVALCNRGN